MPLPKAPAHVNSEEGNIEPVTGKRVKIMLEENDSIPPTGQFFGHNGRGYLLRPGEEAEVPEEILNILDDAVMSVPYTDASGTVLGYRDKLRFPYRVIVGRRTG